MTPPPLLFPIGDNRALFENLLTHSDWQRGEITLRQFPDGEHYVRVQSDCRDREVILLADLHQPDHWLMTLLLTAGALREQGARGIGLIAPYLPYMRQDHAFNRGEAVSARLFVPLLAQHADWLVTVDPHLHRIHSLAEVCAIPHRVVAAAPLLAQWLGEQIAAPLLIGPDAESEQWVAAVAARLQAPCTVLSKIRRGDREVEISGITDAVAGATTMPGKALQPVLLDDMIATGNTLIEAVGRVREAGLGAPVCVAVHGLFCESADARLYAAGISHLVTTNSIAHASNAIDLSGLLVAAANDLRKHATA